MFGSGLNLCLFLHGTKALNNSVIIRLLTNRFFFTKSGARSAKADIQYKVLNCAVVDCKNTRHSNS